MADEKPKREPRYRKPCPDLPKGQRCPLCGSSYICVQWQRKKLAARNPIPSQGT
jgi:hypothetical protein